MLDPREVPPEDWVRDPYTLKLMRHHRELRNEAHERLMDACSRSTDPDVRGQYERFMAAQESASIFNGGAIGSRNDGA